MCFFCIVYPGPSHPSGLCLAASATCVPHNPACDEGLACPHSDPPRVAASVVMLRACRRWHLARLALPRADAHKPPVVTAHRCEIRC
jgi:hypothetical protein